jgi:phage baseplate assembly protein W
MAIKRGFTYPLQIENGTLMLSEDLDLVREAIYSVLETRYYERVMRPSYGTPDYIFTAVYSSAVICDQVYQALDTQIPDVTSWKVDGAIDDTGTFVMTIDYMVDNIPQPPVIYRLTT